jgi:hypothetical protein
MAQVAPLRECPSMVVVSTAIRSRSIHLGTSHHCCSVVFVAIFELFHSHSLFQGGRYIVLDKDFGNYALVGFSLFQCFGFILIESVYGFRLGLIKPKIKIIVVGNKVLTFFSFTKSAMYLDHHKGLLKL